MNVKHPANRYGVVAGLVAETSAGACAVLRNRLGMLGANSGVSSGLRGVAASCPRLIALLRCSRGVTALEFAFVGPILMLLLIGIMITGLAVNNYIVLTNAAAQGSMTLSMSRGVSTPYSTTSTAITSAAASLTTASITVTMTVNGTACTSSSCTVGTAGQIAVVKLSYPCTLGLAGALNVFGSTFGGSACSLNATSANVVQ